MAQNVLSNLDNFEAKHALAVVLFKLGKEEEGLNLLSTLIDYDPTGKIRKEYIEKAYQYAVYLYKNRNYNKAIKYFKKIIKYKGFPVYYENSLFYISNYYFDNHNYKSALIYLKDIISNRYNFKDEDALFKIGLIYYDEKKYIHAYKIFREFVRKYPNSKRINEVKSWMDICERNIKYFN